MHPLTRRHFLAAGAAASAALLVPARPRAAPVAMTLAATTRVLDLGGRAAPVLGLVNAQGGNGLVLEPGQRFRVDLTNALDRETSIHWHGQIPPHAQDGVPGLPLPALTAGETRSFDFAARPGTHWMHAHIPVQEMELLAAPLIVRDAGDAALDRQEAVIFLHDFSFRPAAEVLAEITGGGGMAGMGGMDHGAMSGMGGMSGMSGMSGIEGMAGMSGMPGMAMDLNDFDFDAYLANDRTLADPEVVQVDRGGRVLLRIINAAAATAFGIDTGALEGRLLAVDGQQVQPLTRRLFSLAMGQRLDIDVTIPASGGGFPILALREGGRERTGIVLATKGSPVARLADLAEAEAPAFSGDLRQEAALAAMAPLPERRPDRMETLMLGGSMQPYLWTIDGRVWGNHRPVRAKSGERVELGLHNMSMMAHPMHLHGHAFQVVGLNGRRFAGAVRDTVLVPPMATLTVALDAGEPAGWMLHCHHMPHLATGMMTEFAVSA